MSLEVCLFSINRKAIEYFPVIFLLLISNCSMWSEKNCVWFQFLKMLNFFSNVLAHGISWYVFSAPENNVYTTTVM